MQKKSWQPLRPGAIIDIIAPASSSPETDVRSVHDVLTDWELIPRISPNLFGDDILCANSDEQRLQQLVDALYDPSSSAVWCLRGGYGSTRLLPALAALTPPTQSKLFMGFSDITALHIFLQQQWGWQTLHSPSARQVGLGLIPPKNIDALKHFIFGEQSSLPFPELVTLNSAAKKSATLHARMVGGNLSIVAASIGTFWQLDTQQTILFLEDVNERAHRIDRMLTHLHQAGMFENVSAVLLGDFTGGEEAGGRSIVSEVLARFANSLTVPVLHCPGIGHGATNYPLPLNMPMRLQLDDGQGSLTMP